MDYYEILQISPDASDVVVKAAYKALVKKFHPDNGNLGDAEKLKILNEAYSLLSNPDRRKEYDDSLRKRENLKVNKEKCSYQDKTESFYENDGDRDTDYEDTEEPMPSGKFRSVVHSFVQGVSREMQRNRQIEENAYYDGLSLDDYDLVRSYRNNYGLKRNGYARVLEERGFLERGDDGRLISTDKFKYYW